MGNRGSSSTDPSTDGPVIAPRMMSVTNRPNSQGRISRGRSNVNAANTSTRFDEGSSGLEYGDLSRFESIFRYSNLPDNNEYNSSSPTSSNPTSASSSRRIAGNNLFHSLHSLQGTQRTNTERERRNRSGTSGHSVSQQHKPRRPISSSMTGNEDIERALQMMRFSYDVDVPSSSAASGSRPRRPLRYDSSTVEGKRKSSHASKESRASRNTNTETADRNRQSSSTFLSFSPHQPRRGKASISLFKRNGSSDHVKAENESSSSSDNEGDVVSVHEDDSEDEEDTLDDDQTGVIPNDYPTLLRSLLQSLRHDRTSSSSSADATGQSLYASSSWLLMNLASGLESVLTADKCCPVCQKMIPYDDYELHYVCCLTKPKLEFTEETLTEDKGECTICLEDMLCSSKVARLPCSCLYHISCIERWFKKTQECPLHPSE